MYMKCIPKSALESPIFWYICKNCGGEWEYSETTPECALVGDFNSTAPQKYYYMKSCDHLWEAYMVYPLQGFSDGTQVVKVFCKKCLEIKEI